MFTPCGEDPQGRCNLLRRATSLARYAYLSGMRAMRPAVFRVTNRRLEPVSLPGKVLPVPGTAWTLLLSRRKPWQRRSLLLREFLWHRTLRLRLVRGGYILATLPSRHAAELALRPVGATRLPLAYGMHQALLQQAPTISPSGRGAWASAGCRAGGLSRHGAGRARPPPRISRRPEPTPTPPLSCRPTLQRFADIAFG